MRKLKEIAIHILGWLFVVIGIFGLFLPFLQGFLFILIGLTILSSRSKTIRRFLKYLEHRFPRHHAKITKWRVRVSNWFLREPKD